MNTREFLHLPTDQIRQILDAAVRAGLAQSRLALLGGIDLMFISSFHRAHNANAQLLLDLNAMNGVEALSDGSVPLFEWLNNAATLAGPRAEADVFRIALEALKIIADASPPGVSAHEERRGALAQAVVTVTIHVLLELGVEEFWPDPRATALHKVLKVAYGDVASIKHLAAVAGVDMSGVPMTGGAGDIWFDLLSVAIRSAKIKRLLDVVLKDSDVSFYHPQIQRIIS